MASPTNPDTINDEGVFYTGGGYLVKWSDFAEPYYLPVPESVQNETRYCINWEDPEKLLRLHENQLQSYMRSGAYLEKAFANVESYTEPAVISELLIDYGYATLNTFVINVGGVTAYGTTLDEAKWRAVGAWYAEYNTFNPVYLKIAGDSMLLAEQNTFFVI